MPTCQENAKENKDFELSYTLLHEIKNLRKSYLKLYKTLLSKKKGVDLYSQYKKASELVNSINEKKGIKEPIEFTEIINGIDWYIAIKGDEVKVLTKQQDDSINVIELFREIDVAVTFFME